MLQYQIKTEKGLFFITQMNSDIFKITLLEDFTSQIFESDENDYESFKSTDEFSHVLGLCESLHNSLVIKYKNDGEEKSFKIIDTFTSISNLNTKAECDAFLDKVLKNGREKVQLTNKNIIIVCKPLLCFENKDDLFKSNRLKTEKEYWLKQMNQAKKDNASQQELDMACIAEIMSTLF